jgi:DNA-binding CsgD family transcriptional regulator
MSRFHEDIVQLTGRECQVLRLVALGLSAKETAIDLSIAPCTVERHIENVRLKTRTRNRAHMIAHVIREGMLPVAENAPIELARAN